MKVLVACEFSGIVRDAFIAKGHEAISCDLLPSDKFGEHIQDDVIPYLIDYDWDLLIAFPPCKYLCNGGNNWLNRRPDLKWRENRDLAYNFFMKFINAPIPKIAVENPIGCISSWYRKPDQIIQPYMFGHQIRKDTCLWLKNLPKLIPTNLVNPPYKKWDFWSTERHKDGRDIKAITFQGIADAMAEQWGELRSKGGEQG
jgi:hypothetical protein